MGVFWDAKKLHTQKGRIESNEYEMGVARLVGRLLYVSASSWEYLELQRLSQRIENVGTSF